MKSRWKKKSKLIFIKNPIIEFKNSMIISTEPNILYYSSLIVVGIAITKKLHISIHNV